MWLTPLIFLHFCAAALEMLVEFKISGLPVLDDDKRVVRPEPGRAPRTLRTARFQSSFVVGAGSIGDSTHCCGADRCLAALSCSPGGFYLDMFLVCPTLLSSTRLVIYKRQCGALCQAQRATSVLDSDLCPHKTCWAPAAGGRGVGL